MERQSSTLKRVEEYGKTVGLLFRLTHSIWRRSSCLVLDIGFCVSKGLVERRKVVVFAATLIKKRRYWPKYIHGDAMKHHFQDREVGSVDSWPGKLDGVPFHKLCMKEPDYAMALMIT
jgi:Transposase IS4